MDKSNRLEFIESDMAFKVAGLGLKVYLTHIHRPCRVIPMEDVHQLRDFLNANYPVASGDAPAVQGVDAAWLKATAEFWYDKGVKEGAAQWAHALHLLKARAESVLNGSPKIVPLAALPVVEAPAGVPGPDLEWPKGNAGESLQEVAQALLDLGRPMDAHIRQIAGGLYAMEGLPTRADGEGADGVSRALGDALGVAMELVRASESEATTLRAKVEALSPPRLEGAADMEARRELRDTILELIPPGKGDDYGFDMVASVGFLRKIVAALSPPKGEAPQPKTEETKP